MTEPTLRTLTQRLYEAGQTGLDLSPGDPLCLEAANALARKEALLENIYQAALNHTAQVSVEVILKLLKHERELKGE